MKIGLILCDRQEYRYAPPKQNVMSAILSRRAAVLIRCGLAALLGLTVGGCRTSSDNSGDDALVRLINASPRAQDLAVAVDGKRVWRHSQFRSNTGYASVGAGSYKVVLEAREDGRIVSGSSFLNCDKGRAYTVLTLGHNGGGAPDVRIFGEDRYAPVPQGRVRVRFVNAIAGGGAEADLLFNNIAGLPSVAYGSRSGAILLQPGTYDVKVNEADQVSTLAGPVTLRFQAGHAYTLVAMGQSGSTDPQESLSLEAYPDDKPDEE